jgi:LPPG:FO 2-phospho-L-lactate transferase
MVVALAGGVGGAKLAQGLYGVVPADSLTVIVNTADDFIHLGLHISPDIDTVVYTLAGIANPATGWGIQGDTFQAMAMLARYGQPDWFSLGDRDFATHIMRTEALGNGRTLTEITAVMTRALGVAATILPMCDQPVATLVDTPAGRLAFQEYFVQRHQRDEVLGLSFAGVEQARVSPAIEQALASATAIVVCPSNPFVSIGPILAVPGLRHLLATSRVPRIAISPIVGGQALKGPAGQMLRSLGHEVSALGVAKLYVGLVDVFVIDAVDAVLAPAIEALGLAVLMTQTVMGDRVDRERLAAEIVACARQTSTHQVTA